MLGTITPLGEWSRNRRWGLTMTGYVLGSIVGGAVAGGVAGLLGVFLRDLPSSTSAPILIVFSTFVVAGALIDLNIAGSHLPTVRRQVSQSWPQRYRGIVYGTGFGLQLGAGLTTIVTNSATYLLFLGIFVNRDIELGLLAGAGYGFVRSAMNFATTRIRTPAQLAELRSRFDSLYNPIRFGCAGAQAAIAAVLVLSLS